MSRHPRFREIEDYLPKQKGSAWDGKNLELKPHQEEALANLAQMRLQHQTIALLYHATGTGKTVTAVSDAKRCGGRCLFLAHTQKIVEQAAATFCSLWPEVSVGLFMDGRKEQSAHVVCGFMQARKA